MSDDLDDLLFKLSDERKAQQQRERARDARGSSLPSSNVRQLEDARLTRYVASAVDAELSRVESAPVGERNDALNKAGFALAQLVGADMLDERSTWDALEAAARRAGLTESETIKTLRSSFAAGKQHPRELPSSNAALNDALELTADAPFGVVSSSSSSGDDHDDEPPTDRELDDFWSSRELLTHVHRFAQARRCSPWAVLGVVLARIAYTVPPTVVLPPLVGSHASLNYFVGLVGRSGAGKGAAERVAAEAVLLGEHVVTVTTGSGEGIAHAFVKRERGGDITPVNDKVMFSVPEIDTLTALSGRQGATLMPELRRGWSGEQLGFQYVDASKRLVVEAHKYRMVLVAGIQPGRAKALLDEADGGTPQRFLWMPAIDPTAPDDAPAAPAPYAWDAPLWRVPHQRDISGKYVIDVCELARKVVNEAALARARGEVDALDGHLLLCQLKTAALLAIADRRLYVSDDDWQLAELVIRQSNATRASIARALDASWKARNVSRAESDAVRTIVVEERVIEAQHKRVCRAVLRVLGRVDSMSHSELRNKIAARDREGYEPALEALLSTGQIEQMEVVHGVRYRAV